MGEVRGSNGSFLRTAVFFNWGCPSPRRRGLAESEWLSDVDPPKKRRRKRSK